MVRLKLLLDKTRRRKEKKRGKRELQRQPRAQLGRKRRKEKKSNREQDLIGYSMDTLMAEQEEQTLRFSLIPISPHASIKSSICILEEWELHGHPDDLPMHDARFPIPGQGEKANLPSRAAYCCVDRSHFFFAGTLDTKLPQELYDDTSYDNDYLDNPFVISASSPPAGPWEICARLLEPGSLFVPVSYGGNIYLFDVLVYYPPACSFTRRRPVPQHLGVHLPLSYFIWRDDPRNDPLILLPYCVSCSGKVKLLSYHAGDDRWEVFDHDFPCHKFNYNAPFLLPGTDTVVIVAGPCIWRIYNLSARKLTAQTVPVDGMWEVLQSQNRRVINTFCRRSSCGSFLVFAFIEGTRCIGYPGEIAYAKIRVTRGREGNVVAVASQGDLFVGPNYGAYIPAEPSTKRKGPSSS